MLQSLKDCFTSDLNTKNKNKIMTSKKHSLSKSHFQTTSQYCESTGQNTFERSSIDSKQDVESQQFLNRNVSQFNVVGSSKNVTLFRKGMKKKRNTN